MYGYKFEVLGKEYLLVSNLKASNKGWANPINITLLGPRRKWTNPIILRSKRVKKATDKSTNKPEINQNT